jgi:uncharacterized repeat protein (TIGR02543 family)
MKYIFGRKENIKRVVILSILMAVLILPAYPPLVSAKTIIKEFYEDCAGTKYTINISTEDTWKLPEDYKVTVTITIRDMGGNQYLLLDTLEVGVLLYVKEQVVVNKVFSQSGEYYTTTVTLKSNSIFYLIGPGETSRKTLYVELKGEVKMTYLSASLYDYESFDINLYAPPAPITISASLPSTPVRIGDKFNVSVFVRNDGDYPITDIQVEAWEPFGASIIDTETKMLERLGAKKVASFTFTLEAKYSGTTTMTIYVSFKTITGYEVSKYDNKKDIKITINKMSSSITCTISSEKIIAGDVIEISGKLTPSKKDIVYLIIQKPDGKIEEKTLITTTDGLFSYEFTPDIEGLWTVKARWLGDLDYENCTSPPVSFNVEKLEVKVYSELGTVTGAGKYSKGETVTVSVSPTTIPKDFFTNYVFEGWILNDQLVSTSPQYTFTVEDSITLTASWKTQMNVVAIGLVVGIILILIMIALLVIRRWK